MDKMSPLNMRDSYIVQQALVVAIEVMSKVKFPEQSNIEDMQRLRRSVFNQFHDCCFASTLESLRR